VTTEGVGDQARGLAAGHVRARFTRALSRLYLLRTGVSLVWALTVSAVAGSVGEATSPSALVATLLFLYPITDAGATWVDIRTTPAESQTLFQRVNLVTSVKGTTKGLAAGLSLRDRQVVRWAHDNSQEAPCTRSSVWRAV
jgi:hypothetical protein